MNRLDQVIPEPVDPDLLMSWTWGTVQEDLRVLLDGDTEPLPFFTSSIVSLYPGQRVRVDRRGRALCITGASTPDRQIPSGGYADSYTEPGTSFSVRDGASADLEHGFPLDGVSGWLEVLGDGQRVLQRYTTYSLAVYVRRYASGEWSAWKQTA